MTSQVLYKLILLTLLQLASCVPQAPLSITQPAQFLQSEQPDLAGPGNSASDAGSCGGCYVVADVAGLVWYSEVFINTAATAQVQIGVANDTRATRTSILQDEGAITFGPSVPTGSNAGLNQIHFDSTVTIAGAVLSSPTAYNVFTAFSVTSSYLSNGVCHTDSGTKSVLPTAYSEVLSSASGRVYLDQNGEQQFIDFLGFTSCSGGGENVVPTALVRVENTTATSTTTFSNVPLAALSATLTIAPSLSASPAASSSIVPASASPPLIVVGNTTLTPTAYPVNLPTYNMNGSTAVISSGYSPASTSLGNATATSVVPFASQANDWRKGDHGLLLTWAATIFGLLVAVSYL